MQSSPSPTSIIASINQSNYLCSQAPDQQSAPTQQVASFKEPSGDDIFQRPTKTAQEISKQSGMKQVYIVQQSQEPSVAAHNITENSNARQSPESYAVNGVHLPYKNDQRQCMPPPAQKFDIKNLGVNNYMHTFSRTHQLYENQQLNRNMYIQPDVKIDPYNDEKLKFYLSTVSDNSLRNTTQKGAPPTYTTASINHTYIRHSNNKNDDCRTTTENEEDFQDASKHSK